MSRSGPDPVENKRLKRFPRFISVVCCPWAIVQVSAASIARGRFQAPCCIRFYYSLEVTPLGWSEGCAQFLASLHSWRVLAPETECWRSSQVARGMWVVVLTDLWADLIRSFPRSSSTTRSSSVQPWRLLCLIALLSLDRANLNFSSN